MTTFLSDFVLFVRDVTPEGILNPGAIDAITVDDDGYVTVHIEQTSEWDGSDHLLLLLQEKLYNYLAFIADGEGSVTSVAPTGSLIVTVSASS